MHSIVRVAVAFAAAAALAGGAQAADTSAKGPAHKAGAGVPTNIPDVAKTPSPGGPIPIPYPNVELDKDGAQKKSAKSKEGPLKNQSQFKKSTGDEAQNAKGLVSKANKEKAKFKEGSGEVVKEGRKAVIPLTPIDEKAPDALARQTPKTDFGSAPGQGAGKPADVVPDGKKEPALPDAAKEKVKDVVLHKPDLPLEKAPKPFEPVKQPVVVAPKNPVDAPPHPLPVKLGPPTVIAPPQVTPPVAAPPVKVPVVVAPPVPIPVPVVPLPQPVVIQPVQPQPVLQTQPVLRR